MLNLTANLARWRTSPWWRKFVFAFAGTAGFIVDASLMQLMAGTGTVQVHLARLISFLISMTVTWQINRHFTFRDGRPLTPALVEWPRYLASSLLGGASNYAAFAICIAVSPFLRTHLILPVAVGCLTGMVTNYVLYSRFVFRKRDADELRT